MSQNKESTKESSEVSTMKGSSKSTSICSTSENSDSSDDSATIEYAPIRTNTADTTRSMGRRFSLSSRRCSTSQRWSRESMMVFADVNGADLRRESSMPGWNDDISEEEQQQQTSSSSSSIEDLEKQSPNKADAYHVFTYPRKRAMVYIVSLAGLFSPLSSNIYFPALKEISDDIHVDISLVSLTVTVYMVVQGIAPSFWGPISDTKGRRIVFIFTFIVYLIANACLAFSKDYISLMVFRGVQAAGSAATISIGAGVIGDIATVEERGGLIGIFGGIRMLGQSIGPVFGGLISEYLGYHAIFWFLFGLASITLLLVVTFLPETLRSIAGNGSIPLHGRNRPLYYTPPPSLSSENKKAVSAPLTFSAVVSPLRFLFEKDVFATLFFGSVVYTVWSMVTSSTTDVFTDRYGLNTLEVGLCYLPNGAGCVAGSYLTGMLMDRDFKIVETAYRQAKSISEDTPLPKKELAATDFPIEHARQRNIWWIVALFSSSVVGYGFSLDGPLPVPLILQFAIAYSATAVFSLNSALVIDLYPGASASATAVNNLVRCSIGAAGVALIQPLIDVVGAPYSFTILAGITVLMTPLLLLVSIYCMQWRLQRAKKLECKDDEKRAVQLESGVETSN